MATSASKAAPQSGAGDTPAAANKFRKLITIILAALLLAGAGGGGAWYFLKSASGGAGPGAQQSEPARPPVFMALETFTVNLQAEDVQQFLQVNMTLQVANDTQIDLLKLHMPHVRNRLLLLLSNKKPSEILSADGKKKLSAEIIELLKQPFTPQGPSPQITDVLFTSFVVQ